MEFQTFNFAYLADVLESHLSKFAHMDPTVAFQEITRIVKEHNPVRDEEATEPEHALEIVWHGEEDFKIKGRSYLLFKIFAQILIQWYWAPTGDPFDAVEAKFVKRLFEQLNSQIELEELEFDTDVTWSIKAPKDNDLFVIKVATRMWSAKVEVLKY